MKTQNIIQPLRNHLKPLALAVTAGVLLMSHTPAVANITLTDTGTVWWANSSNATIINSFTANASANVLVVSVSLRTTVQLNSGNAPVVTYDGVPLTVAASALGFNAYYISTGIYYMFNPPTASAKDLTVSFPAGGNLSYAVDAYTLGGVDTSKQPELFPGWTATTLAVSGSNPTSVSVTLSNLISGSWVASSVGFRNTNSTNSFSSSVTSGSFGVLNTSGPVGPIGFISTGNLWAQRTSDTIGAGALVEDVTSPSVTVEHTGGAVGALFNVAGVAFAPLVGPSYTISGAISTYDAADAVGALVELKVGGIVHAQKTVPSGGAYSFTVPVGTYTIRASKSPYLPIESSAIVVTDTNITQDLVMPQDTIPPVWVSGWPKAAYA